MEKLSLVDFIKKGIILTIFLVLTITFNTQGQYSKLLNSSEKQIREKVKNYKFVIRDSSEHEFVPYLTFKNRKNEPELVFTFFFGKCYMIRHFTPKKSFNSAKRSADKLYDKIEEEYWRDKEKKFEVRISSLKDKVMTTYTRGVSNY